MSYFDALLIGGAVMLIVLILGLVLAFKIIDEMTDDLY